MRTPRQEYNLRTQRNPTPPSEEVEFGVSDEQVQEVNDFLDAGDDKAALDICNNLDVEDIAELIEKSDPDNRGRLLNVFGKKAQPEMFTHIDSDLRSDMLQDMSPEEIASIISKLESDDALDLIEDFDKELQKDTLRCLSKEMRAFVEEGLTFPEDSAGRLMQRELVSVPQFWTVGRTAEYLRAANHALPEDFYDIFVVDPKHHVIGKIPVAVILRSKKDVTLSDLIEKENVHTVSALTDQEEVAHLFQKYALVSTPVVDESNRLIGMITVDDIVDVIHEEAEEDFLKLGGVSHADMYRAAASTAKARFSWLAVNLMTAISVSLIIRLFEATIQEIVALAVLMPIVASMGGNAGTQTLTMTIRALATRELSSANAFSIVRKEVVVGLINGILFALMIGFLVWWWFTNPMLGVVISLAMLFNMIVAGFFGITIPLLLVKLKIDPALSSAIFLTTITDIFGFFVFLGLAALILL